MEGVGFDERVDLLENLTQMEARIGAIERNIEILDGNCGVIDSWGDPRTGSPFPGKSYASEPGSLFPGNSSPPDPAAAASELEPEPETEASAIGGIG